MTDLANWLLAQIKADEAAARAAYDEASDYRVVGSELAELHFVNWKPDRVLADCAAKRKIVQSYQWHIDNAGRGSVSAGELLLAEQHARALAQPFADRPGWDPAWKVET